MSKQKKYEYDRYITSKKDPTELFVSCRLLLTDDGNVFATQVMEGKHHFCVLTTVFGRPSVSRDTHGTRFGMSHSPLESTLSRSEIR